MPARSWPRVRYAAAVLFLVTWAGGYALDGVWYGDFWAHASMVRELAARPFAPLHPQLAVDAPHAFFSPYALALGWVSRITGLDAIGTLAIAGIGNALLLGLAMLAFCRTLFGARGLATAFWSLVLVLFWWGDGEWFWSGFVHAGVFGYVASYPSTFALALSLFGATLTPGWLAGSGPRGAAVTLLLALVLITHPVTAVFTIVAMTAVGCQRRPEGRWRAAWIPLAILVAVGLAARWPLYPFLDLFVTDNGEFHARSRDLYLHLWARTYPIVLGLPLVLYRLRRRGADALAWSILALLGVYGVGYVTQWYGLGRVVSPAALLVQVGLARELVRLEEGLASRRVQAVYAASLVLVVWMASKADRPLADVFARRASNHAQFAILDAVADGDVILSDLATGWPVPAFGPKVVASEKPLYWVDDHQARRHDVLRFFDPTTPEPERRVIVDRHRVKFVLVASDASWSPPPWVEPIEANDFLTLFQVVDPAGRDP